MNSAASRALLCALVWGGCAFVRAALVLEEDFDYPDGPLVEVSGTRWQTQSGVPGETRVTAGRLELSADRTEDVFRPWPDGGVDPGAATNRLYARFTLRGDTRPARAGSYFAMFRGPGSTQFPGRIWAFADDTEPGAYRLGVSANPAATSPTLHPRRLFPGVDYQVVLRLSLTDGAARLWIDPRAESDEGAATDGGATPLAVAGFAFRQTAGEGSWRIDSLRVGTRFVDVVPGAPIESLPALLAPPRHLAVPVGQPAAFHVAVTAEPAAGYQWFREGRVLPGATSPVLAWDRVGFGDAGFYHVTVSNALGVAVSAPVALNVLAGTPPAFSLLTYNLHGNEITNWTTNSSQIQAIGRQVRFLDPDILALQEIPVTNNGAAAMAGFVQAYRPGFFLATNSTDDTHIRSVVISRFPILNSRSWLAGADLGPYGDPGGRFTRDLFEAEMAVPGWHRPLRLFVAHLKSGQDATSATRRAAEGGAVSNFLARMFLAGGATPYLLAGDFNEDLLQPPARSGGHPGIVPVLANDATGLRLTTPFNPVSGESATFSIRADLIRRYDYILPCGVLWSNVVASQVFRTDLQTPLPAGLLAGDDRRASDHLPVLMIFGAEPASPFHVGWRRDDQGWRLTWPRGEGWDALEFSPDLAGWADDAAWVDGGDGTDAVTPPLALTGPSGFWRVRRMP